MILKSGYGLLHKKSNSLLGVSIETDNSGESVGRIHTLENDREPLWIVEDKLTASYVRVNSTEWYNAGYDTPVNPFDPEELDVVKIELNVMVEEPTKLPTNEEYLSMRYNTKGGKYYDPDHYQYVMSELKKYGRTFRYSLYDLELFFLGD
jgi:hypothetical protein